MDKEYSDILKNKLQGINTNQLFEIESELKKIHKDKKRKEYEEYKNSVNYHEKKKYEGKIIKKHHEKFLKKIDEEKKKQIDDDEEEFQ